VLVNFTLRQLEYFVALSEHETLSAAAATLHISESTLSHATTELEKSLGIRLCHRRKSKGLTLTSAGRHFADRARMILQEIAELALHAAAPEDLLRGPVRLGCFSGVANNVLPEVLEGLAAAHPQVEILLTVATDHELLPALFSGKLDLVILYDMLLPPNLNRRTIYGTEVTAVVHAEHRLAEQQAIRLADLAEDPFIMVDSKPSTENTYMIFREQGVIPQLSLSVPSVELAKALVGRNLGYTLLMSRPYSTDMTTEGKKIAARPLSPSAGRTSVVAVWPKGTTPLPRTRAVMDFAAERMASTSGQRQTLDGHRGAQGEG
jgi:DNA-binding transcriptional LysR family regulator